MCRPEDGATVACLGELLGASDSDALVIVWVRLAVISI